MIKTLKKALCYLGLVINGDALVIGDVEHLRVEHVAVAVVEKDPVDLGVVGGSFTDQAPGKERPVDAVFGHQSRRRHSGPVSSASTSHLHTEIITID